MKVAVFVILGLTTLASLMHFIAVRETDDAPAEAGILAESIRREYLAVVDTPVFEELTPIRALVAAAVEKVATERGVSPTQMACAWVLQAPGVTAPIIGATKIHHLKEIFEAVDIKLSTEEVARLEEPYQPHPILGHVQPSPKKLVK